MNDAHAVQATAYALMAHMNSNLGTKVEREMMMAWLNTMRNSIGGFAATQVINYIFYSITLLVRPKKIFDIQILCIIHLNLFICIILLILKLTNVNLFLVIGTKLRSSIQLKFST